MVTYTQSITIFRGIVALSIFTLLTGCAELNTRERSDNPQSGDRDLYLFELSVRPDDTPVSAVLENSVKVDLVAAFDVAGGSTVNLTGSGFGTWDATENWPDAYCDSSGTSDKRFNLEYDIEYKTSTFFVGTRTEQDTLNREITITRRDDVVFFGARNTRAIRTENPVRLLWTQLDGITRSANLFAVDWLGAHEVTEIHSVTNVTPNPQIEISQSFRGGSIRKCGDWLAIQTVCLHDHVSTPQMLQIDASVGGVRRTFSVKAVCSPL